MTQPGSVSMQPAAPPPAVPAAGARAGLGAKLLRVAWMSIGLGVALELLLMGATAFAGGLSAKGAIADLVQKLSWGTIVCVGLAVGTAASKARTEVMGLLGAISAPLGFTVARTLHKSVGQAMGLAVAGAGASPFLVAGLKAVEYALLGAVLGALDQREGGRTLASHVVSGGLIGLTFGSGIVAVMARAGGPVTVVSLLSKGINEVLFPLGCSLVLYFAGVMRDYVSTAR